MVPAMNRSASPTDDGRRRDGMIVAALAAYAGFAAFLWPHETGGAAHAGVPVDAVLAVTAASGGGGTVEAPPRTPRVRSDAVIPEGANVAEPAGNFDAQTRGSATADPASPADLPMQFLVKFEDAEAAAWRDRYRANPNETREAWDEFARENAPFSGLKLAQPPNYSGVATLELAEPAPETPAAAQELSEDIVSRLSAADGVEYAEPNLVATREKAE
jgi:hypothetical protein